MTKYFTISHGLRGCYMPDSDPFVAMCKTRKELKSIIESEAGYISTEATQGFSKRAIASFVAECWREAHKAKPASLPYALGYKEPSQKYYSSAIFCSVESRRDYLAYIKRQEEA